MKVLNIIFASLSTWAVLIALGLVIFTDNKVAPVALVIFALIWCVLWMIHVNKQEL